MQLECLTHQTSLDLCWPTTHMVRRPHPAVDVCSLVSILSNHLVPLAVSPTFDLSVFKDGLEVIVPQPLTIRVPIAGYPTPSATWTYGDRELTTADERVTMTTKSTFTELVVTPSVRPDKGTYSLRLENDVTSVSADIEVNVIGRC